ncbi:MFS transporter [Luedemannella helvata]|uniref:MFS transporter n=1 Tax=Luedemannella helvata TaxID=349315 RepID=A0ABP4XEU3_9ACTN
MPLLRSVGRAVGATARGTRAAARGVRVTATGGARTGRWVARNVRTARNLGGDGNIGMMRLLDLHAASCAGDTLIMIGLASTIFFGVPTDAARGRVALYLLVTMVPFALLAPLVGPLLDRFRHGRRYALATTMLGRGVLAWVISANLLELWLYPAAFGVLVLSRAYGVARSAAVPRLLPRGMGLSQAGARASVFGTVAGAVAGAAGGLLYWLGPQWPLRLATLVFAVGMLIAMNLPPRADSDPPEVLPKIFQVPWRHGNGNGGKLISGRLLVSTVAGSASLRALYGFLLLFLAFAVREGDGLALSVFGATLGAPAALALVGGALALGTFLATAVGAGLHIRRPTRVQSVGLLIVTATAVYATLRASIGSVVLLCLATAIASGLAKLSVDATIQERVPESVRASAFAHAETLLMLAWVAGAAVGLVPFGVRWGLGLAALALVAATARAFVAGWRLRGDRLTGRADGGAVVPAPATAPDAAPPAPPSPPAASAPPAAPPPATAVPVPKIGLDDDEAPPGFTIYRPSSRDSGVTDPRSGT